MSTALAHPPEADLAECRALLRRGSKSFAAAALLLPKRVRDPAAAVYAFCRWADDAIDEAADKPAGLREVQAALDRIYGGAPVGPFERAFARVVVGFNLPRALPEALVEGFAWDAAGRTYADLPELSAYCARVAASVGAMMTVLMGPRDPETLARACDLGVAMQLTNIARDVGEDARAGRCYLPTRWLAEVDPGAMAPLVLRLLDEADVLYARADAGIARLPPDCQAAIRAARLIYADIGRVIRARGGDSVSRRAVVSGWRKLWLALRAVLGRPNGHGEAAPPLEQTRFLVQAAAT